MRDENDVPGKPQDRRAFIKTAGAAAIMSLVPDAVRNAAYAAGSDAPEKKEVKVGFIPLTDCASVVMASVLGIDQKYGIKIIPTKEASWASVRDKLVNGDIDAAHVLYGLIYGVQMGVGGPKKDMNVLMTLNFNGQAITLSKKLADAGAVDGPSLAALMKKDKREYTFAQTFPTGTHAMWLYYWLAANGVHPFKDAKIITVPPPQMVANMRVGNMDGYCVGEPWGHRAIADGIGITAITTQDIWKDHPEKVLGCTAEFTQKYPNTARAMTAAIIEAGKLDRHLALQPSQDGRDGGLARVRQHVGRRHQPAHPRPLPERPGQDLGRPQSHEVLRRGRGELPRTTPTACGSSPSIAAGVCSSRTPTTSRWRSR